MSNITAYPLQDGFETTLAQSWNGATGTVYLNTAPSFTFPVGVKTYIVVNPGKTNMQVGEIDSLNVGAKTVNVSSISIGSGAGTTYTQESHSVGSTVIISDNYQFWKNIVDAVNTKIDGLVQGIYFYADATARNTALGATPSTNGLIVGLTSEGKITYSLGGAWVDLGTGATFVNASTTVAGKVQLPSDADYTAGTATGSSGATNVPTNAQAFKSVSLKAAATSISSSDEVLINQGTQDKRLPASLLSSFARGINATAGENLTANDLVYMDANGSAYKTVRKGFTSAQIGTITGIDSSTTEEMIQCEYLSDDKAIILYKKAADDKIYGTVVTFARSTITVGTEQVISADVLQAACAFSFAVLSSSLFAVCYRKTSDNLCYGVACTVSGTTITAGTPASMSATQFNITAKDFIQVCKVSSSKFLVIGPKSAATSGSPLAICGSISGTTITAGTTATIEAVTGVGTYRCCYIQDDVVFAAYDDGTNIKMVPLTISGTTITVKTILASAVASATMSSGDRLVYLGNGTIILIRNSTQFSINTYNIADQTNWTVATVGTPLYNVNNDTANSSYAQAYYMGNNVLAIANQVVGNSDVRMRLFQIINNSLVPMGDTTIAATAGEMGCCKLNTIQNKLLVVWRETGTTNANFSLYWDTSSQFMGECTTTTASSGSAPIAISGPVANTGMTVGQPYYVGDAGAIATTGTKQIGVALTTTSLLLR